MTSSDQSKATWGACGMGAGAQPSFEALFYPPETHWIAAALRHQADLFRGESTVAAHTHGLTSESLIPNGHLAG